MLIKEAWTEYKPIYETVAIEVCNTCGADITHNHSQHMKEHALKGENASRRTEYIQKQTGTETIAHPAEYETRWVQDSAAWDETVITGYTCSCGASKIENQISTVKVEYLQVLYFLLPFLSEMGGKTVKKLKQILALILSCVLFSSTVQAQEIIQENEENKYEKIIEMYLNGDDMEEEAVVYRKEIAKKLGIEAYLDEKSYLTPEYRFENGIGQDGDITDPDFNILVEMATQKEMNEILAKKPN